MSKDNTISTAELAALTGYSKRRITRAAARGELPHVRDLGGSLRFDTVRVLSVLRSRSCVSAEAFDRPELPERINSAYVARSDGIARCASLMERVRLSGVGVTYDWTRAISLGHDDAAVSPGCLAGVAAADIVIVTMGSSVLAWAELGAAIALRKPVVLVADPEAPFGSLTHRVDTDDAAIGVIAGMAPSLRMPK